MFIHSPYQGLRDLQPVVLQGERWSKLTSSFRLTRFRALFDRCLVLITNHSQKKVQYPQNVSVISHNRFTAMKRPWISSTGTEHFPSNPRAIDYVNEYCSGAHRVFDAHQAVSPYVLFRARFLIFVHLSSKGIAHSCMFTIFREKSSRPSRSWMHVYESHRQWKPQRQQYCLRILFAAPFVRAPRLSRAVAHSPATTRYFLRRRVPKSSHGCA